MKQEQMTVEEARKLGLLGAVESETARGSTKGRSVRQRGAQTATEASTQAAPKKTRHSLLIQDAAATYAPEAHRPGTEVWASSLGIFLGTSAEYGEQTVLYHYCWKVGGWKTARYTTVAAALRAASLGQWEERP